jgi:hypothetical protein
VLLEADALWLELADLVHACLRAAERTAATASSAAEAGGAGSGGGGEGSGLGGAPRGEDEASSAGEASGSGEWRHPLAWAEHAAKQLLDRVQAAIGGALPTRGQYKEDAGLGQVRPWRMSH